MQYKNVVVIDIKLYISLKTIASMELTIIIIPYMELSKMVLENLQYLPLLQLHSPCGADGRIVTCHYTPKISTNNSKNILL